MTETLFTPEEVENLKEACRIGAGSLGEAAGIDCYAMRKLEARLLALIPDGHALVVRTEPLDLLLDKQQPAFIYVFKPKEGEKNAD
jgi:hypothetical protein